MRATEIVLGALAFVIAHGIEWVGWAWFGPNHAPWFLNSGRAAGLTAACLFVAGALPTVLWGEASRAPVMHGTFVGVGGVIAMATVLAVIGPGTIFPIVLVFGSAVLLAMSIAGAVAGAMVRAANGKSGDRTTLG